MSTSTIIPPLPGSDAIGHSYDVFGYYGNAKSVKSELFDFGVQREVTAVDRQWLLSDDFQLVMVNTSTTSTIMAHSRDEYSQELAASVNVTGGNSFFSASVDSDFSKRVSKQADSTYMSIIVTVEKWKLSLRTDDIETLRSKTKPRFRKALATMDPVELFDAYGTHFLGEVLVGGRANYVSTSRTSVFQSDSKLRVAAEASYNQVSAGASGEHAEEVKRFRENSSSKLYAVGGDALADIQDSKTFYSWLQSIDKHPVFSGFTVDSLIPIWKLAETEERQRELKLATEKFVPNHITRPALVDLEVISWDSCWGGENPSYNFSKIDFDLNRNAKGKYIFLCQKQANVSVAGRPGDLQPITDVYISICDHNNPTIRDGYVKIDKDLNEGAGGKYIFLCYTRNPDKAKMGLPIRSVCVVGGSDLKIPAPYGFTLVPEDLNCSVGGDYIYLCYSRHFDEAA